MASDKLKAMADDLDAIELQLHRSLHELEKLDMDEPLVEESELARLERDRDEYEQGIGSALRSFGERLLLYTEVLQLPETRQRVRRWLDRWSMQARFGRTKFWASSEGDGRESPAFSELYPLLKGVTVVLRRGELPPTPLDRKDRERLEYCLRSLAKLCFDRKITPSREYDVQSVLHSHLSSILPGYTKTITISKPLTCFRPDGGIPSLKSAVECKFVGATNELPEAIRGVTGDLSGYSGSDDWKHFYSVVYMTGPYAVEGQFQRALGMSGHAADCSMLPNFGMQLTSNRAMASRRSRAYSLPGANRTRAARGAARGVSEAVARS